MFPELLTGAAGRMVPPLVSPSEIGRKVEIRILG